MKKISLTEAIASFGRLYDISSDATSGREHKLEQSNRRQQLAPHLGVCADVLYRWTKTTPDSVPRGLNLITLLHVLKGHGLVVDAHVLNDADTYNFSLILATKQLSLAEAGERLGYKVTELINDVVLSVALGRRSLRNTPKWASLQEIITEYLSAAKAAMEKTLGDMKQIKPAGSDSLQPAAEAVSAGPHNNQSVDPVDNTSDVAVLADLIKRAIPLAKMINEKDDAAGIALRKELRERTALGMSNGVFALSNILPALCGEHARKNTGKK